MAAEGGSPARAAARTSAAPGAGAGLAPRPADGFLASLPSPVKHRVLALKKLQRRCDKLEAKFDKEFQALERKYNDIYEPLVAKIDELTGEMEGYAWALASEDEDEDDEEEEETGGEAAGEEAAKGEGPQSAATPAAKKQAGNRERGGE